MEKKASLTYSNRKPIKTAAAQYTLLDREADQMFNKQLRMNLMVTQKILAKRSFRRKKLERTTSIDRAMFSSSYQNCFKRIYHYIYFRMTDEQQAEDLTSQVFLKAWENKDHYKPTGAPFITWLYSIARNAIIDDFRTRKPAIALDETVLLVSDQHTPDEECEIHFEIELLHSALQRLTIEQQQVLKLKYLDGLTTDQVAARLGKRTGSVRALQMRALRSLSRQLETIE
jgi:RNA polymerase sigma-70 factor, ECF subfamily